MYVGFDREPLKVDEGWSDPLPGLSVAENHGSRVVGLLEPMVQASDAFHRQNFIALKAGSCERV